MGKTFVELRLQTMYERHPALFWIIITLSLTVKKSGKKIKFFDRNTMSIRIFLGDLKRQDLKTEDVTMENLR